MSPSNCQVWLSNVQSSKERRFCFFAKPFCHRVQTDILSRGMSQQVPSTWCIQISMILSINGTCWCLQVNISRYIYFWLQKQDFYLCFPLSPTARARDRKCVCADSRNYTKGSCHSRSQLEHMYYNDKWKI